MWFSPDLIDLAEILMGPIKSHHFLIAVLKIGQYYFKNKSSLVEFESPFISGQEETQQMNLYFIMQ